VYPAIPQLLADLNAAGRRLFIATSKPTVYALPILKHFGLDGQFAAIYGSELDGRRADKRALLAHILEIERLQASEIVMVGDRKHDIIGARANGIRSIGVTYGYGSEAELKEAGADLLCASVDALRSALLCLS
jgi:phosphoglycolate phosphatase